MCLLRVRREKHFTLAKPALEEDTFHVGECSKAILAVIRAHAGRANPAKGDVFLHNVPSRLVDRHAP